MALAVRFEGLLNKGVVANQAEPATRGHVSHARVTQIMNLIHLAPEIQEVFLFLPRMVEGREPIHEKLLRPIAMEMDWGRQRSMWAILF